MCQHSNLVNDVSYTLEERYLHYLNNFSQSIPDGITNVDFEFLQSIDYCSIINEDDTDLNSAFYTIRKGNKTILHNDEFVIWIIEFLLKTKQHSFIMISLNNNHSRKNIVESMLSISGVYHSADVLPKVIAYHLHQIRENNQSIDNLLHHNERKNCL